MIPYKIPSANVENKQQSGSFHPVYKSFTCILRVCRFAKNAPVFAKSSPQLELESENKLINVLDGIKSILYLMNLN